VLDGDRLRLTAGFERHFRAADRRGLIDHHASSDHEGYDLVWLEPEATSTCEMVYHALLSRGVSLTADQAVQLHTGSVFDTGSFRYSNTTPQTLTMAAHLLTFGVDHAAITSRVLTDRRWAALQLAARLHGSAERSLDGRLILARCPLALQRELGTGPDDLEGVIEGLISVLGCEVAAVLQERAHATKVSFRSRGRVDVSKIARALAPTGGGHAKAAGCLSPDPLPEVERRLIEAVRASLS
jgi:phosphoesterase RecJ-like protein